MEDSRKEGIGLLRRDKSNTCLCLLVVAAEWEPNELDKHEDTVDGEKGATGVNANASTFFCCMHPISCSMNVPNNDKTISSRREDNRSIMQRVQQADAQLLDFDVLCFHTMMRWFSLNFAAILVVSTRHI